MSPLTRTLYLVVLACTVSMSALAQSDPFGLDALERLAEEARSCWTAASTDSTDDIQRATQCAAERHSNIVTFLQAWRASDAALAAHGYSETDLLYEEFVASADATGHFVTVGDCRRARQMLAVATHAVSVGEWGSANDELVRLRYLVDVCGLEPDAPAHAEAPPNRARTAGWVLVGSGAAEMIAGAVILTSFSNTRGSGSDDAFDCLGEAGGFSQGDPITGFEDAWSICTEGDLSGDASVLAHDLYVNAREVEQRRDIAGGVLLGVGAASTLVGAIVVATHGRQQSPRDVAWQWSPTFGRDGAGARVDLRF